MWKAASLALMTAAAHAANLQSDQEIVDEFNKRSGLHCDAPVIADWPSYLRYPGIFVFTGANVIYLRAGLDGDKRKRVLFHELGHCGLRTRNMGFHQEELAAQTLEKALMEGYPQDTTVTCYGVCPDGRNTR